MTNPKSYIVAEDLRELRNLKESRAEDLVRLQELLSEAGAGFSRGAPVLLLALLYAFRGVLGPKEGHSEGVASPGLQVPNAVLAEVLGFSVRELQRAFESLTELGFVFRVRRQVAVSSLGLETKESAAAGEVANAWLDSSGAPHVQVELPSVTYLLPKGRAVLDRLAVDVHPNGKPKGLLPFLQKKLAPTLRALWRRFQTKVIPTSAKQRNLIFIDDPQNTNEEAVNNSSTSSKNPLLLSPKALTPEGYADGLIWEGGLFAFAEKVSEALFRTALVSQYRLDNRCLCGLTTRQRKGAAHPEAAHASYCRGEPAGSAHPTGRLIPVPSPAFTAREVFPQLWADQPSSRDYLELLAAPVVLEVARLVFQGVQPAVLHEPTLLPPLAHRAKSTQTPRGRGDRKTRRSLPEWHRRESLETASAPQLVTKIVETASAPQPVTKIVDEKSDTLGLYAKFRQLPWSQRLQIYKVSRLESESKNLTSRYGYRLTLRYCRMVLIKKALEGANPMGATCDLWGCDFEKAKR